MIKLPDTDGLQDRVRLSEQTGPGPRLRAAREAAGCYEVEDIAKQLRLSPDLIVQLEADKFPEHLALVFVRGYLRAYAGIVGLNPDEVVEEFNALGYREERALPDFKGKATAKERMRTEQEMQTPNLSPRLKWAAIGFVLIALGGVFFAYNYEPQERLYPVNVPPEAATTDNSETFAAPEPVVTSSEGPIIPATATPPTTTARQATAPARMNAAPTPSAQTATPTVETQKNTELELPRPGSSSSENFDD